MSDFNPCPGGKCNANARRMRIRVESWEWAPKERSRNVGLDWKAKISSYPNAERPDFVAFEVLLLLHGWIFGNRISEA